MRPYTIPAKLKPLTEPQFTQLHTWLEDLTLKQVRENLRTEFGIEMSDSALCRYNQTRDLARHLTEKGEDTTGVQDFLAIMNGQPVPYSGAGIELVMKRAFDLTTAREITPAKLATLLKVFHYKKNCEWNERRHTQNERRLAQADTRNEITNRLVKVREDELALKKSKPAGSSATERFKLWSPEELEARQAEVNAAIQADPFLRQIALPPEPTPASTPGRDDFHGVPNSASLSETLPSSRELSTESAPSAVKSNTPESLEQRVNKYTLARHHEALIGKDRTKVGRATALNFISALQHCPCGKAVPCPDHGDFPRHFWEASPDNTDYFEPLHRKKLPFTPIHELLAREPA